MTPETLKRLEELYDKWCNDLTYVQANEVSAEVVDHLPALIAAVKERNAFAMNMDYSVRLGIAIATEQLQKELEVANKRLKICAKDRDAAAAARDALQELVDKANHVGYGTAVTLQIERIQKERDQLAEAIKTPEAVWTNMLRGTIARPVALEHYEECKAALEKLTGLEGELEEAHAQIEVMRGERDGALANLKMKEEWCNEWKRTAEALKESVPAANKLCHKLEQAKQERDAAHKAVEPLVAALNQISENHALCETDAAVVEQALAHWEKVKEVK